MELSLQNDINDDDEGKNKQKRSRTEKPKKESISKKSKKVDPNSTPTAGMFVLLIFYI